MTGKYLRDQTGHPEGSRFATSKFGEFPPVDKELGFKVVDRMIEMAVERDISPTSIAIGWLLSRPAVTSVIIGVRHLEQLGANVAATEMELSRAELDDLTALTAPPTLYPAWMIERQAGNRKV